MMQKPAVTSPRNNYRFGCLGILLVLLGLVGAAVAFLPWKNVLEGRLVALAHEKGLKDVSLRVHAITPTALKLKDVSVGGDTPMQFADIALDYSPGEIIEGRLERLTINGLTLSLNNDKKQEKAEAATLPLPFTPEQLEKLPFAHIAIENSRIEMAGDGLSLTLPFTAALDKAAKKVILSSPGLSTAAGGLKVGTGAGTITLTLEDKKWTGPWEVKDIVALGMEPPLPSFAGKGKVSLNAEGLKLDGNLASKDNATRAAFRVDYPLAMPEKAMLHIASASMPWHEGTISSSNIAVALAGKRDIKMTLQVEKVSLDALMQLLTGKRASATGLVSGAVPITIKPDGNLLIHDGSLKAEAPGTISLQEDAIPGDNEQLALVRQILKKLNYNVLSVSLENDKDGKLAIRMALEGLNPDFQEGHPVKLNVQLGGDVLGFLQQNVMLLFDPKKILEPQGGK